MTISDALRHTRIDRDLHQSDVAAEIGVSQASYSAWERGASLPKVANIPAIARFLDVSESEVLRLIFAPDEEYDRVEMLAQSLHEQRNAVSVLTKMVDSLKKDLASLRRQVQDSPASVRRSGSAATPARPSTGRSASRARPAAREA